MNKIILICISLLLIGSSGVNVEAQNRPSDKIRATLLDPSSADVLVVAHRGDWRYAPENSLAAIENAIKMGVDIVELDVAKTKDGQLILMHDTKIDRTTTGKGKVDEWTLDSLKTLNLRNGCAIRTKHTIPTLEEALLLAKGRIMVNLDKSYDIFDEVYAVLEKTGTTDQVIMKGKKPLEQVKREFGRYLDKVLFMPIVDLDQPDAMQQIHDYLKGLKPVAFELLYLSDTNPAPKEVARLLKGKSRIWYNTLWDTMAGAHDDDQSLENPDRGYGYLIDTLDASILQTDRPAYLIEYLRAKNRRDLKAPRE
ncbi:glycerophosphodiester phosphodiesterase family protein [Bacteroides neonati]|uniref:glycerophosphodiester phosphodiesterase family protein n=1 Tax=Bacteroides neonati TaxID=1347393 RepID=UPI0004B22563|nr:glycerophosphodiester phosphodiesterase family protein [Bacteroides neonati]